MVGITSRTTRRESGLSLRWRPALTRLRTILVRGLVLLVGLVMSMYEGRRDRELLAGLDDRQLRDIGIDRAVVGGSDASGFWRAREPGGTRRR